MSATYTSPAASTASPAGWLRPVNGRVTCWPEPAGSSSTWPETGSVTNTSAPASTAIPHGPFRPVKGRTAGWPQLMCWYGNSSTWLSA